jgi:hypothetical protein
MFPFASMMMGVVHPPLTNPQATPSSVSKTTADGDGAQVITTASVTASASGGSGGAKSYSWSRVSGSSSIVADSASSASTTFSATHSTWGTLNATFRCTISDPDPTVPSVSVDVPVQTTSIGLTPTVDVTPANHTFSRSGAGAVNCPMTATITANNVGPYTVSYDWLSDDGTGSQFGGPSSGLTSPISVSLNITLTTAPQSKPGTLTVHVTDETTGAVGSGNTRLTGQST